MYSVLGQEIDRKNPMTNDGRSSDNWHGKTIQINLSKWTLLSVHID